MFKAGDVVRTTHKRHLIDPEPGALGVLTGVKGGGYLYVRFFDPGFDYRYSKWERRGFPVMEHDLELVTDV